MHVVQLYPSVALEITYPSTTELFFCFKPIFDFLTFTTVRQLRENLTEKLTEEFVPFCRGTMTEAGFEFVKEKLSTFAASSEIEQPNRNKLYALVEAMEIAADFTDFAQPTESGKPRIDSKSALKKGSKNKVAKAATPVQDSALDTSQVSINSADLQSKKSKKALKAVPLLVSSTIETSKDPQEKKKDKIKSNEAVKEAKKARLIEARAQRVAEANAQKQEGVDLEVQEQPQPKIKATKEMKKKARLQARAAMNEESTGNGVITVNGKNKKFNTISSRFLKR